MSIIGNFHCPWNQQKTVMLVDLVYWIFFNSICALNDHVAEALDLEFNSEFCNNLSSLKIKWDRSLFSYRNPLGLYLLIRFCNVLLFPAQSFCAGKYNITSLRCSFIGWFNWRQFILTVFKIEKISSPLVTSLDWRKREKYKLPRFHRHIFKNFISYYRFFITLENVFQERAVGMDFWKS